MARFCLPKSANKKVEPEKFKAMMLRFFGLCNHFRADKTVAIVEVPRLADVNEEMVMAFYSVGQHAEMNFIAWWKEKYPNGNKNKSDETPSEITMYINRTPCIGCAKELRTWLNEKKNNVTLSIHFMFVYTDPKAKKSDTSAPMEESDYIEEVVKALGKKDTNGNLRIQKISQGTLPELMKEYEVQFKGYSTSYDSSKFEDKICGNWRERDADEVSDSDSDSDDIVEQSKQMPIAQPSSQE